MLKTKLLKRKELRKEGFYFFFSLFPFLFVITKYFFADLIIQILHVPTGFLSTITH